MPASNTSLSVLGAAAAAAVGPAVDDIWGGDSWSNAATALRIRSAYTHDGELKEAAAAEEEEEEEEAEEEDDDDEEDDEDSAIVSISAAQLAAYSLKCARKGTADNRRALSCKLSPNERLSSFSLLLSSFSSLQTSLPLCALLPPFPLPFLLQLLLLLRVILR